MEVLSFILTVVGFAGALVGMWATVHLLRSVGEPAGVSAAVATLGLIVVCASSIATGRPGRGAAELGIPLPNPNLPALPAGVPSPLEVALSVLLFGGCVLLVGGLSRLAQRTRGLFADPQSGWVRTVGGAVLAIATAIWLTGDPVEIVVALLAGLGVAWVLFGPHWSRMRRADVLSKK